MCGWESYYGVVISDSDTRNTCYYTQVCCFCWKTLNDSAHPFLKWLTSSTALLWANYKVRADGLGKTTHCCWGDTYTSMDIISLCFQIHVILLYVWIVLCEYVEAGYRLTDLFLTDEKVYVYSTQLIFITDIHILT